MPELSILAAVCLAVALWRWCWPLLKDRYAPLPIPEGWEDPKAMAEIKPTFTEPLCPATELPAKEPFKDPKLGPLPFYDPDKLAHPVLFDAVADLHSVDLGWRPAWLDWLVTA